MGTSTKTGLPGVQGELGGGRLGGRASEWGQENVFSLTGGRRGTRL